MVGTVGNIDAKEQEIIDEFALFDDWMDKYEHIIGLGKELPLIEESLKTDDLLIKGCQSRVWLHAKLENGKVIFTADSDAIITKGIINLLIRVLSGEKPDDIVNADMTFIDQIGLKEHLSPTRSNGLVSMVKQMKLYALAFKTQMNNPS
jgi:cysteine desulfuration protein SufE